MMVTHIHCDRCGKIGAQVGWSAWTTRDELHGRGWRSESTYDHCPECLSDLGYEDPPDPEEE